MKQINLIGISGKIKSGKDTVGKMIQYFTDYHHEEAIDGGGKVYPAPTKEEMMEDILECMEQTFDQPTWQVKKFADKLKDMVCLLIGCTREQLEDQDFKNTPLGQEWSSIPYSVLGSNKVKLHSGFCYETAKVEMAHFDEHYSYGAYIDVGDQTLTPRKLMQLLGTECGRQIIHPNIWVNALFATYRAKSLKNNPQLNVADYSNSEFPKWIITDVRFPNEAKAIKDRGGIVIRINRKWIDTPFGDIVVSTTRDSVLFEPSTHPSETALDNYEFDYVIENDSDIPALVEKVRVMLKHYNLL